MKTYGERRFSTAILDFGIIWKLVVSFTPRLLFSLGKSPWHLFGRALGEPWELSGSCGYRNICFLASGPLAVGIRYPVSLKENLYLKFIVKF
jgi:hypothetical protein